MDSKLLLGVSAAAAFLGLLYFMTREVDVDEPSAKGSSKSPAKQAPKNQSADKNQSPQKSQQKSMSQGPDDSDPPTLQRSMTMGAQPPRADPRSTDLVQFDGGVITTDSLVKVLKTIKEKYVDYVDSLKANFKQERRTILKEDPPKYRGLVLKFRDEQMKGLETVFAKTLEDFGIVQDDITRYNKRHGNNLFFSHMERMMTMPAGKSVVVSLALEELIEILEDKAKMLSVKLVLLPKVTQDDLMVTGFMVEDLIAEKYGKEEDEVNAAVAKFRSDQGVLQAMGKINAFKPR